MQCLAIIFLVAAAAKRAAADEIPHDGATESREPTIAVGRAPLRKASLTPCAV